MFFKYNDILVKYYNTFSFVKLYFTNKKLFLNKLKQTDLIKVLLVLKLSWNLRWHVVENGKTYYKQQQLQKLNEVNN